MIKLKHIQKRYGTRAGFVYVFQFNHNFVSVFNFLFYFNYS